MVELPLRHKIKALPQSSAFIFHLGFEPEKRVRRSGRQARRAEPRSSSTAKFFGHRTRAVKKVPAQNIPPSPT